MNYSVFDPEGNVDTEYMKKYLQATYQTNNIPEVWFLLMCFYKLEIPAKLNLADTFLAFSKEFYPEFKWYNEENDANISVSRQCFFVNNYFLKLFRYGINEDITLEDGNSLALTSTEKRFLDNAYKFGSIIREFLIGYCGYSIVYHDTKTIISNDTKDERIKKLLDEGYILNKVSKITYTKKDNNLCFEKTFDSTTENTNAITRAS